MYSDFYKFLGQKIGMQLRYLQKIVFMLAVREGLALSLLVVFVLGTDNHDFAVSFNNFALIAHRFYRRSDFHNISP